MTQSTDPNAPDYVAPSPLETVYDGAGRPQIGQLPGDPDYHPSGVLKDALSDREEVAEEDKGPVGMPAAAASDAPFSETTIPSGWARFPTADEVAYLNEKFPV